MNCDNLVKPLLGTHKHEFAVILNSVHAPVGVTISCRIELPNGTAKIISVITSQLRYTALPFTYAMSPEDNAVVKAYTHRPWVLKSCTAQGMLAKDYNLPIFVHGNTWTEVNWPDQDMRRAKDCWDNQYARYFSNGTRCDFEGDYVFARGMARGVPIGLDCSNCADRACKGISYQCIKSCFETNDVKPCKEASSP